MTDLEYTLAWVNERRVERGLEVLTELPRGEPGSPYACTVARGLEAATHPDTWRLHDEWTEAAWHPLPPRVQRFIRAFDARKHRELIA